MQEKILNGVNKKILYGVLGLVVIALVAWAIVKQPGESANKQPLREKMEVSLTDDQRAELEQMVSDRRGQIEASKTQSIPAEERLRLHIDLALALYNLGDLVGSRDVFLQALEVSPGHLGVYAGLFPVYRDMYDYDAARNAVKRVLSASPKDWNMWRNYIELEQFHFNANRKDLDKIYREALEASNNDINIITVYAKFLEDGGDKQSALNYWKIAVQQNPNNKLYQAEIKRLEEELKNQ